VVTWNVRELPYAHRGFGLGAFFSLNFLGNFINPLVVMPMVGVLGTRAAAVQWWGGAALLAAVASLAYCWVRARPLPAATA
jgi:hypothetical protein